MSHHTDPRPHLLFLSHCVPNPPNKGEKIRAYHELSRLARDYRIHLACFARTEAEMADARALRDRCASVYVELLPFRTALLRAAARFALGACLNTSFYRSGKLAEHVNTLKDLPLSVALVYSGVMMQYAPAGLPVLLDMVDVDSEKWAAYGKQRRPGALYSLESRRLRRAERQWVACADRTFVSTRQEQALLEGIAGRQVMTIENGVDFDFFDPAALPPAAHLQGRQYLLFAGSMDYYPNADGVCGFATTVYRRLRRDNPRLEFLIVGNNPSKDVMALARMEGVTVTGFVPDVRPYLAGAWVVVAPLRIARGIQNKVLEALAMNKPVLASSAVCRTFGPDLPVGVGCCDSPDDYRKALAFPAALNVRRAAASRFNWAANVDRLANEIAGRLAGSRSFPEPDDSLGQNPEVPRCAASPGAYRPAIKGN